MSKLVFSCDEIIEDVKEKLKSASRVIVLIGGASRAGKSTLSEQCHLMLENSGITSQRISIDNWILAKSLRTPEMDVFKRFQSKIIENDFSRLLKGEHLVLDAYDAKSQGDQRVRKEIQFIDKGVIWIDGVITLALKSLVENSDLKVFVEADENVRKERLNQFYKDKGLGLDEILNIYEERNIDEVPVALESSKFADIVFRREM